MISIREGWDTSQRPKLEDVELGSREEGSGSGYRNVRTFKQRRRSGMWTVLGLLAVMLGVLAGFGYWVVKNQNAQISWLPGLSKSVSSLRERTTALEASLKQWSSKQETLAATVQKLDSDWGSRLKGVRQYAAGLVASAIEKEHAELDQRTAALNAQVAEMKSRQQADQVHLAQLENDLAGTRQALASVRDGNNRQLAALQQQQASTRDDIASLNDFLSTDQVDFEAQKGRDEEIVPGVSFHLTGTDIAHQRFRGWILLHQGAHRIWFRRQALESPVVFYPESGDEAYELVVTRVNQRDVVGYLLVPSESNRQQAAVASNLRPKARAGKSGL
jgi:cell division protein FtsB